LVISGFHPRIFGVRVKTPKISYPITAIVSGTGVFTLTPNIL
jgi:hypothetical protein